MRSEFKLNLIGNPIKFRIPTIRSWREEAKIFSDTAFTASETHMRRSLRKERALSGQDGYDLNRHIRLLRQRRIASVK